MLKFLSAILTLLGIFVLSLILFLQKPLQVDSTEQLLDLTENQLVIVQGEVIEEKYLSNSKMLILDNNLEVLCDSYCHYLINRNLTILGTYDNFMKPRIKALKIFVSI